MSMLARAPLRSSHSRGVSEPQPRHFVRRGGRLSAPKSSAAEPISGSYSTRLNDRAVKKWQPRLMSIVGSHAAPSFVTVARILQASVQAASVG
jgi:hypothetical protein